MKIRLDTSVDGFLRADSRNARRFVGPKLGPAAMNVLATLGEVVDSVGGSAEVDLDEVAARVGLSERGLEKALDRLDAFDVVSRSGGELVVREWIDTPSAAWRADHYPVELAAEFKMLVDSVIAAQPSVEVEDEPCGPTQTELGIG